MEFPTVGAHCAQPSCQSLSFLPHQCSVCHSSFCSTHRLPTDHECGPWSALSHAASIQVCSTCEQMLWTPKGKDPQTILKDHVASGCKTNLMPEIESITVPCALEGCKKRDRVVATCPDCNLTFCLGHRHPSDHRCSHQDTLRMQAEQEKENRQRIRESVAKKFGVTTAVTASTSATRTKEDEESRQAAAKDKAEASKAAIAAAKLKVAARNQLAKDATSALASANDTASPAQTPGPTNPKPAVKKASRVVSLLKLRKIAQGEDKIPVSSRIYVYIRSPLFPQLNDKAIYVDKTWTVGRAMDKIIEWLKITPPANEPFQSQKRFSIFHAKEIEDTPILLPMSDRIQQLSSIENGDVFLLATADWDFAV